MRHGINPTAYNENLTALFAASLGANGLGLAFTYASSRNSLPRKGFRELMFFRVYFWPHGAVYHNRSPSCVSWQTEMRGR